MYFFDTEDYCYISFMGPNNQKLTSPEHWDIIRGDANNTRGAMILAVSRWRDETIIKKPDGICTEFDTNDTELYSEFLNGLTGSSWTNFWDLADNSMEGVTKEIYDEYINGISNSMCILKSMLSYLDGDTFEDFTY